MPKKRKPSYLLHQATGQARVRIKGRDHYLGVYGSPESRERYNDLIEEWFDGDDAAAVLKRVDDLALLYIAHARIYYRKRGQLTSEFSCIRTALRYVVQLYGTTLINKFGPRKLKAVRQAMIDDGICRKSINKNVTRIRGMFKWGVEEEIVDEKTCGSLLLFKGLEEGRSEAVESDPVEPVPDARVEAIRHYVSKPVWAMIQLQLLTGMRPGEVLIMRGGDLNTSAAIWEYVPGSHKTEHKGRHRTVFIGPQAQAVLKPLLKRDPQAYVFCPRDVSPGKPGCTRQPGARYNRDAYRNAITRGCERAFRMPKELRNLREKKLEPAERTRRLKLAREWRQENCWNPHRLRHNAGTVMRREAGLEGAQVVLGHKNAKVTEIYAERDKQRAREVVAAVG
jgi:integrase